MFAAVERGGRVKATVLPSRRGQDSRQAVEWVEPTAIVYTDEWPAYNRLGGHFAGHSRVRHSTGEYVVGTAHTNTIEGFFGHLKPSIRGTYRKVSHKWLQGYLNEFTFRYNERHSERRCSGPCLSARRLRARRETAPIGSVNSGLTRRGTRGSGRSGSALQALPLFLARCVLVPGSPAPSKEHSLASPPS